VSLTYIPERDSIVGVPEDPRLLSVCFEPTNRCAGRCPYCLIEGHQRDAPTEGLVRAIATLLDSGTMRIGFGGGEPLVRNDIYQLGEMVRARNAGSLLRTSAMYWIDAARAATAFDWIDISFDSLNPDVFRRCRPGVPYEIITGNIINLSPRTRVRASILVTAINFDDVLETISWLADAGVRAVRMQTLVARGRARRLWSELTIPDGIVAARITDAMEHGRTIGLEVFELKSINSTTLAIVKADGSLYSATPNGLRPAGSIYSAEERQALAVKLENAQRGIYLELDDVEG
jgi:MoaA/NifB/PqqE/SkfB family radical SAM enzyme